MRRRLQLATLCAALLVALAGSARGQSLGFPWWKTEAVQKDLGLTPDQSSRIESIFQTAMVELRPGKDELDTQESKLSRMIETNADESAVTRQVEKVEAIRAQLNKTRTLMLLHMRQVLTADQRVKLKALHEQRDRERKSRREERKQ